MMEENFSTQLSDNRAAEQRREGLIDYSDAIDPVLQAEEIAQKRRSAGKSAKSGSQSGQTLDMSLEYVRENPMQALGVAAGIGLMLGLLLKSR